MGAAQDGLGLSATPEESLGLGRRGEIEIPPAPLGLVAFHNLWKHTRGTFSLDLKRKLFKGGAPGDSLWRVHPQAAGAAPPKRRGRPPARPPAYYGQPPAGAYVGGAPPAGYGGVPPAGYGGGGAGVLVDLPSLGFMDTGARVKVMRHVQFGPGIKVERPSGLKMQVPALDLGVGLAFELDTAELRPQARLKFRDIVSLRALPYPAIKVQKRIAMPDSSWGVRLRYECPLEALPHFHRPPARLLVSIDNMHSNGAQLTQAGLEFNYAGDFWDGKSQLRAAGLVALPRELPVVEGQALLGLEVKRLGLKAGW